MDHLLPKVLRYMKNTMTMETELCFTQEEINEFILKSYEKNLNTTMHAVGDRALECHITART